MTMTSPTELPEWLRTLREEIVLKPVQSDPRSDTSRRILLGVDQGIVFNEVINGGQADFTESWNNITPNERALLYAYLNQKGHLEELIYAFDKLFPGHTLPVDPIMIDIGCGPFTAGLAFAAIAQQPVRFDYIGVDRAESMMTLGERLAIKSNRHLNCRRTWTQDLNALTWDRPPGYRPVIVVMSYVFASPTISPSDLADQLAHTLGRVSHGRTVLLYTNSQYDRLNTNYPIFRSQLLRHSFTEHTHDKGTIEIRRSGEARPRHLQYAVLYRPELNVLNLREQPQ
jgi:hypothetical protein